jgi:GMP synthase (glutamine-hydrolysing)
MKHGSVIMGGPQSPSTTQDECPRFDAASECALIAEYVITLTP